LGQFRHCEAENSRSIMHFLKMKDPNSSGVTSIKTFLKDLGENFTWKNCLIEHVHTLFHTRVRIFVTKYINCEKGILGRVEHHMC